MQQNEKNDHTPQTGAGRLLCLVLSLCLFFTVLSFYLWNEGDSGGSLSASVAWLTEVLEENKAIAVFLGWEEGLPA